VYQQVPEISGYEDGKNLGTYQHPILLNFTECPSSGNDTGVISPTACGFSNRYTPEEE